MAGLVEHVDIPLFLRKFNVPFWALAFCFGKDHMYWYRLESSLGRISIVGTTVKFAENLPHHLLADEKHTRISGEKRYIATTVTKGCILGACAAESAGYPDLKKAYNVFKKEALDVDPDYTPVSVNTDGWDPTRNAWKKLFPAVSVIACFLHVFIGIRSRCSKKFKDIFRIFSTGFRNCYKAESKASFSQRVRRLHEWSSDDDDIPAVITETIRKLRKNLSDFSKAYDFTAAHRTSNMIDRLMQRMDRHLFSTKFFHGNLDSSNLSIRAWALIENFAPFNPRTSIKHGGTACPAEKLNGFRYHENWLHNLLISGSLGG